MKDISKGIQEQAVASWVNYLNQLRLDYLTEFMQQQDRNLSDALYEIEHAVEEIHKIVDSNRGGISGSHGFIAEIAEVGISNARQNIIGNADDYIWSNDNGPVDLIRSGVDIQQKFYQSGLSLGAINAHLEKYPDFIKNGGKYQIPKDQYEKIEYLLSVSKKQADKMPTSDGTFSLKQWKAVHEFFDSGEIKFEDVEPSKLEYCEVQRDKIEFTMQKESDNITNTDAERRAKAREESMPSMKEGVKVTVVSAAIEGGTSLALAVAKKKKEGKSISNYNSDDWKDVLSEAGGGTAKGGVRGLSIYALSNYTATPAAVASALVTASFGVADQVHLLRKGEISETQFIENSEILCLDSAACALSSFVGQVVIPVPILGAIIGNAIGMTMYNIAKDNFSAYEKELINNYIDSIDALSSSLDEQYEQAIKKINDELIKYYDILNQLYSCDIMRAFDGSIQLAILSGVPSEEILDSREKIQSYFMN